MTRRGSDLGEERMPLPRGSGMRESGGEGEGMRGGLSSPAPGWVRVSG